MIDAALLFAAGFGTRMRPLTDTQPKPLIEVAGRALLDHALEIVEAQRVSTVAVNAHYRADQIEEHLRGRDVHLLIEHPNILDTGGGLLNARDTLGHNPVFTLNTDAVWAGPPPLAVLHEAWDREKMDALMLCVPLSQTKGRAAPGDVALDLQGRIVWGGDLVYTGVQIMDTKGFEAFGPGAFSMHDPWRAAQSRGRLFGVIYDGNWCDVGTPANIVLAEEMLRGA